MENDFSSDKKSIKFLILIIVVLIGIIGCAVLFFALNMISRSQTFAAHSGNQRQYHIIIAGKNSNNAFLQYVYRGASRVAAQYNAVVELRVPASRAEDVPLQTLIDYASCVRADGIIAYIDDETSLQTSPVTAMETAIPLVALGNYFESTPKIAYIGTGYYELGRVLAREILWQLGKSGNILAVVNYSENNPAYSLLMNGLQESLAAYPDIHFSFFEIKETATVTAEELMMQGIASSRNADLILCLSHDDTVRAAQVLIDLSKNGKVALIGFHESDKTTNYLRRGVITSLISYNPEMIGEFAMREIFEYKKTGHANEYIMADIRVLKKDSVQ